jgi:hypothetical protein
LTDGTTDAMIPTMAKLGAELDMKKFEDSLLKFSKSFGDTTQQAVIRWGVQASRELAVATAVFGGRGGGNFTAGKTRDRQLRAIWSDALNVILAVDNLKKTRSGYLVTNQGKSYYVSASKVLNSESEVNQWIRINRTRRRRRTAKLSVDEKRVALRKTVERAVKARHKATGQAKGGWLDAGQKLSRNQTGGQRIAIGKGFIGYAQKSGGKGSGVVNKSAFSPSVTLENHVSHSGDSSVLSASSAKKAINDALPMTIKWYKMAMRPKKSK